MATTANDTHTPPAFYKVMRENPEEVSKMRKKKFTRKDHESVAKSGEKWGLDILLHELFASERMNPDAEALYLALEEEEEKQSRKRVRKLK